MRTAVNAAIMISFKLTLTPESDGGAGIGSDVETREVGAGHSTCRSTDVPDQ